ncbi:MAG: ATP-binding protein [Caldilinea sp. CFX5]|nr:ATP-binding protein [Caldilinea sp. CFX5]
MASDNQSISADLLRDTLHQMLTSAAAPEQAPTPLAALCLFQQALRQHQGDAQAATRQLLDEALTLLATNHPEHAAVLRSRLLQQEKVEQTAQALNLSVATFHRRRHEGAPLLANVIWHLERNARAARQERVNERLGSPTYTQLFGKGEQIRRLAAQLTRLDAPWLFVVAGIGGIGKTTLADALVRHLLDHYHFADMGWVTARSTLFNAGGSLAVVPQPLLTAQALVEALSHQLVGAAFTGQRSSEEALAALGQRLKNAPHLIVIDNLESVVDVAALLPTLRRLVNPSKILLTTRYSLTDEADLHHTLVPELLVDEALALVRQEAAIRNIPQVLAASDTDLLPIYETVGGNPLALRLVTGQVRVHSLAAVLDDLLGARGKQAEALYTFIYQRAWELLDETARAALIAMPLVSEQGGHFELLAATCDLPPHILRAALERLVTLNLVDVRGDLHDCRYTIHSLTRAFLHEQVIRWQKSD